MRAKVKCYTKRERDTLALLATARLQIDRGVADALLGDAPEARAATKRAGRLIYEALSTFTGRYSTT